MTNSPKIATKNPVALKNPTKNKVGKRAFLPNKHSPNPTTNKIILKISKFSSKKFHIAESDMTGQA